MPNPYTTAEIVDKLQLDLTAVTAPKIPMSRGQAAPGDEIFTHPGRHDKLMSALAREREFGADDAKICARAFDWAVNRCSPSFDPYGEDRREVEDIIKHVQSFPRGNAIPLERARELVQPLLSLPKEELRQAVFETTTLTALAVVQEGDPALWTTLKPHCGGFLRELDRAVRKSRMKVVASNERPTPRQGDSDSLRSALNQLIESYREVRCAPDYAVLGQTAFDWFKAQGARFFITQRKSPFMVWKGQIYFLNSPDRDEREAFEAMLCKQGGLLQSSREGKAITEALRHIAVSESPILKEFSWLYTDHASPAVFVNMNNERNEIARISPEGVELLTNGDNKYGIFLAMSERMSSLNYVPGVPPTRGAALIKECLIEQFPLAQQDGYMLVLWLICAFLMDFSGTIPLVRVEGDSGAAKTDVEKAPSVLVYGQPEYSKATPASLWANAARDPLVCSDNVEISQENPDLIDFLLLVATKGSREKRRQGTDSGVVKERPRCLYMSDGIEPIGAGLTEVSSRTLMFRASEQYHREGFSSEDVEQALIAHRDEIVSWIFDTVSRVLALIKDRAHIKVKALLDKTLKKHNKKRCHEYFALMYLVATADGTPDQIYEKLSALDPDFHAWIKAQSIEAVAAGGEGHQIGAVLSTILSQWRHAQLGCDADREVFQAKYPTLSMDEEGIHKTTTRDLFVALRTVAKDKSLPFTIQSALQLGRRLGTDREAIEAAGFNVTVFDLKDRFKGYSITKRDEGV